MGAGQLPASQENKNGPAPARGLEKPAGIAGGPAITATTTLRRGCTRQQRSSRDQRAASCGWGRRSRGSSSVWVPVARVLVIAPAVGSRSRGASRLGRRRAGHGQQLRRRGRVCAVRAAMIIPSTRWTRDLGGKAFGANGRRVAAAVWAKRQPRPRRQANPGGPGHRDRQRGGSGGGLHRSATGGGGVGVRHDWPGSPATPAPVGQQQKTGEATVAGGCRRAGWRPESSWVFGGAPPEPGPR